MTPPEKSVPVFWDFQDGRAKFVPVRLVISSSFAFAW
jgi:hypothetical protein